MARRAPLHARPREQSRSGGVDGNTRLTSGLAAIIFVLLFVEGLTIVAIGSLLTPHVFIGALLIPPVLVKTGTTGYRMVRYYLGEREYVRRGPPAMLLRLLGPFVVILTWVLLGSGLLLVVGAPASWHAQLFTIHRASFVLWFGAMSIHVLGHLVETARFAPRDWIRFTRRQVRGATTRQWVLAASVVVGLIVATLVAPHASSWRVLIGG